MRFQGKSASIDEFATLFRSRIDTIRAHGGKPGHHPAQAKRILEREMKKMGLGNAAYDNLNTKDRKAFDAKVKSWRGENILHA